MLGVNGRGSIARTNGVDGDCFDLRPSEACIGQLTKIIRDVINFQLWTPLIFSVSIVCLHARLALQFVCQHMHFVDAAARDHQFRVLMGTLLLLE